ncbi:hypothetical protein GQX74_002969 [Glossina fuscipes]|nr:hypothetical protein GQX74_002969 [Glossina fuscipes]
MTLKWGQRIDIDINSTRSLQIFMSGLMVVKRFIVPNMRAKHKPVGQQNTISLKVTDDFHYFGNIKGQMNVLILGKRQDKLKLNYGIWISQSEHFVVKSQSVIL